MPRLTLVANQLSAVANQPTAGYTPATAGATATPGPLSWRPGDTSLSELHVALRAPLRRQAADRAHAALVVDAKVQRERGQHHHRREVQEDDVSVRGDLQDGGARGSTRLVK